MPPVLSEEELLIGDPYVSLAIEVSATEKEVRRAYRQLSLKYHPDRNPAPEAVKKFREISLAHEILIDIAKRQYVDTKLEGERKKREKYAEMDKKRKDLVDALVAREEQAKKAKIESNLRRQQEAEEEAIKEEGRRMLELAQKRAMAAAQAQSAQQQPQPPGSRSSTSSSQNGQHQGANGHANGDGADAQPPIEAIDLTLLLSIPSTSFLLAGASDQLQATLSKRYGSISHVLVPPEKPEKGGDEQKKQKKPKAKKPRKAVVEFARGNWGGCWACWKDHVGEEEDGPSSAAVDRRIDAGVKAKWAGGAAPAWVDWAARQKPDQQQQQQQPAPPQGKTFSSAPDLSGTGRAELLAEQQRTKERRRQEEEYESMTLLRMRQLERERLAEELRKQEEEEE